MISQRFFAIAASLDAAKELGEISPTSRTPIPERYQNIPGIVEVCNLEFPEDVTIRGIMAYIVGETTKYPARYRRIDHTCVTWELRCDCWVDFNWWLSIEAQPGINQCALSIECPIPASELRLSMQAKISKLSEMANWPLETFIDNSTLRRPN